MAVKYWRSAVRLFGGQGQVFDRDDILWKNPQMAHICFVHDVGFWGIEFDGYQIFPQDVIFDLLQDIPVAGNFLAVTSFDF